MSLMLLFWILMLLWAVIYGINYHQPQAWAGLGNGVLLFALFMVLGWHVFGSPIKG